MLNHVVYDTVNTADNGSVVGVSKNPAYGNTENQVIKLCRIGQIKAVMLMLFSFRTRDNHHASNNYCDQETKAVPY